MSNLTAMGFEERPVIHDRRASARLPVFWNARVHDVTGEQEAVCYNVSHGGLALYLWSPPEADTTVEVTLQLPGGGSVVTRGRVIAEPRGRGHTVGLAFSDPAALPPAVHAYIDRRAAGIA